MVRWCACIALLAAAVASYAATPGPTSRPTTRPTTAPSPAPAPPPPAQETRLDPTRPSDKLRAYLNPQAGTTQPAAKEAALPRIIRRAFLQTGSRPAEALVEVNGSPLISIQQGSTITVTMQQGGSLTIRVTKLSVDEIGIELPATGQKATIR
jgi:hypothetical protein